MIFFCTFFIMIDLMKRIFCFSFIFSFFLFSFSSIRLIIKTKIIILQFFIASACLIFLISQVLFLTYDLYIVIYGHFYMLHSLALIWSYYICYPQHFYHFLPTFICFHSFIVILRAFLEVSYFSYFWALILIRFEKNLLGFFYHQLKHCSFLDKPIHKLLGFRTLWIHIVNFGQFSNLLQFIHF